MGHHKTSRTKRRKNRRSARLRWLGILILAVTALWYGPRPVSLNPTGPLGRHVSTIPAQKSVSEQQTVRAVYPHSVIPGGVKSVGELKNAIANDPVISLQFVNFNLSHARVTRLDQDRFAYVSYRRGNQLFWTTRKLKIPRNEMVITDGEHTAISRCGNLVSETVSYPISSDEPSAEVLDTPQNADPAQTPYTFDPQQTPGQNEEPQAGTPIFSAQGPTFSGGNGISDPPTSSVIAVPGPHPSGGAPSSFPPTVVFPPWRDGPPVPPTPPVVSVPEPSTLALLAISLPLLFVWLYRKRANAN